MYSTKGCLVDDAGGTSHTEKLVEHILRHFRVREAVKVIVHGDPLAQDLMDRFAQGAVQVRFAAQDQRKAVDGIITVIHEHLDVLKNTSGKVLCLIYGQRRLFLFMIEAEDLLLYGAEHSQLSAPALHAQDSAELAVKLHDAHGGEDIFHVVQAGVKAFCKAAQTKGLSHARPGSKNADPLVSLR